MKTIPQTFTTPGYQHQLVRRSDDIAIYSQLHKETGNIIAYEIMVVRKAQKAGVTHFGGVVSIGDENLPTARTWGQDGWTVRTLADAERKFSEIAPPQP